MSVASRSVIRKKNIHQCLYPIMKLWIAKDTLQEANSFHIYLFPVSHSLLQYVTWLIELYVFQVYIRTY